MKRKILAATLKRRANTRAHTAQWRRRMKLKTIIAGNFRTCLEQHNSAAVAVATADNEIRLHCFQFLWQKQRSG